jgi:hypothetical protein
MSSPLNKIMKDTNSKSLKQWHINCLVGFFRVFDLFWTSEARSSR